MSEVYENANLSYLFKTRDDYARGLICVVDFNERMIVSRWPEDVSVEESFASLRAVADEEDTTFADCIELAVEHEFRVTMELRFERSQSTCYVVIWSGARLVGAATNGDYAAALREAIAAAVRHAEPIPLRSA